MGRILDLRIHCLPPTLELHQAALRWAEYLGHNQTWDAQYVAVAEQQAELWSADQRLVHAAHQAHVPWVH